MPCNGREEKDHSNDGVAKEWMREEELSCNGADVGCWGMGVL